MTKMSLSEQPETDCIDYGKIFEIRKTCENLISQTQADLELFKNEQSQLRSKIGGILTENKQLSAKLDQLLNSATAAEIKDDATREKMTKEALFCARKQIEFLEAENKELSLHIDTSRKTICNLELEIQNYREHLFQPGGVRQISQKYDTTIKILEAKVKTQESDIAKRDQVIQKLYDENKRLKEHVCHLETTSKEIQKKEHHKSEENTRVSENMEAKLEDALRVKKKLEEKLEMTQSAVAIRYEREKCALQKVQEALSIAEAAVAAKEDAQKREEVIKEECDNLASTIGQVMDEASRKVEKDMEDLRTKFNERERALHDEKQKLKGELQNQMKYIHGLEMRYTRLQEKYKSYAKEIENLNHQLQSTLSALEQMGEKVKAQEALLREDKILKKRAEENEKVLKRYMQANVQLKEKYRCSLKDLTERLEKEVHILRTENINLKDEILCTNGD